MTSSGPNPDVSLRPARLEDLTFLREMTYEAAFGGQNALPEETPPAFEDAIQIPWVREYYEGWGREGDFGLIAVDKAGENVGAAWYRRYSEPGHVRPLELTLAVREEDRGQSVGETLLKNLIAHAGKEGIAELGLQVSGQNTAARELYGKLGFLVMAGKDEYGNYKMAAPTSKASAAEIAAKAREQGAEQPAGADIGDYFNAFAPLHDRYASEADWAAKADVFMGTAIGLKQSGPVRTALDLGAGTGISIGGVTNHADPERIVAVDVSPQMLKQMLRKRNDAYRIEPVADKIEDYVPDCEETFDLITSLGTLEFVRGLPEVLRRLPELLNRGGLFAATYLPRMEGESARQVSSSPYLRATLAKYLWPPEEIEDSLTSRGLAILHRDNSLPAYPLRDKWVHYNFIVASKD